MAAKVISVGNLQAWIDKLIENSKVFAPMASTPNGKSPGASSFAQITAGTMPELKIRTDIPPKGLIFKRVELLLTYEYDEDGLKIVQGCGKLPKKIIFGIRPCDARAFEIIDKVFLDPAAPECGYAAERDNTALIMLACKESGITCFCTSVGGSPVDKTGDVWMVDLGDRYYVEALTPVGEELVLVGGDLFTNASQEDEEEQKQAVDRIDSASTEFSIPSAKDLSSLFYNDLFWQSQADKCLSCGACTFLCPTCHCFDVEDEGSINKGNRYRTWDSCMFSRFTRAAGGHNPRVEHWKRLRQRMMHKFSYFIENSGVAGCVGCGRCIRSCPVAFDIREFLRDAVAIVSPSPIDFVDKLPNEGDKLRSCDIKPKEETHGTGGELK